MSGLDIRGSGASWSIWRGKTRLPGRFTSFDTAALKSRTIEDRAHRRPATCLSCTAPFQADHRHNRLCPACNAWAAGAMV